MKFAIPETQFAKVSSLEIFSHQNIFFYGIIHLIKWQGLAHLKTQQKFPDIRIFGTLFLHGTLQ